MKRIIISMMATVLLLSCTNKWGEYYNENPQPSKGENTIELDMTIAQFFESYAEYSEFKALLGKMGLDEELTRNQTITVWAANNDAVLSAGIGDTDTLTMKYHINNLSFNKSDLKDGLRIRSINGIYIEIAKNESGLFVNRSEIIKTYQLKNGTIHIIDRMLKPLINMYDYLIGLGDDYSTIRDSIFKYNKKVFLRNESKLIGVDPTGNYLYDSVFKIDNPIFATANFASEFEQFTVLIPSNAVMADCFETLQTQYASMDKVVTNPDTLLAIKWIKEAIFFKGTGVFDDNSKIDFQSAFKRTWRTTVQGLDMANPIELSNGTAYTVTKMKIPNNYVIERLKSYVHYWEFLSAAEQNAYYTVKGMAADKNIEIKDRGATAKPEIIPVYWTFEVTGNSTNLAEELSVEFNPLEIYYVSGATKARVKKVPCGEYNLYMGFYSGSGTSTHADVDVYFNGAKIGSNLPVGTKTTPWNFDRKGTTDSQSSSNWNTLGGLVGTVTVDGEGMNTFKIKVQFSKLAGTNVTKGLGLYHWALAPTANNY